MSLSSHEVCRQTGVSYRQLDYWDRTGLAHPSDRLARGSGTQRRYTEEDVRKVMILKYLMANRGRERWGERMRSVIRHLPRAMDGRWLVIGIEAGSCVVDDDKLTRACIKFGPGAVVVDLAGLVPATERKAS